MDRGWNWDKVAEPFWTKPSEDVYYLLHRRIVIPANAEVDAF